MKKLIIAVTILIALPELSMARLPDVVVNKKGGVFGHYDRVEYNQHSENGQTTHNLNCNDPGWSRCRFSNAVSVGLVVMTEEVLEDIYDTIDVAIGNSQTSGTFLAENSQLEIEWNIDASQETHINIYNNQ